MELDELLRACGEAAGYDQQTVCRVLSVFMDRLVEELAKGNTVDLGKGFGVFKAKLRPSHLAENSR